MAVCKLGDLCTYIEGYVNPPINSPVFFSNNGTPWLKVSELVHGGEIKSSRFHLSEEGRKLAKNANQLFKKGSIVWAKSGSVGMTSILGIDAMANRGIINIIPNEKLLNKKYLFYFLIKHRNKFINKSTGEAIKHFYGSKLMDEEIDLPLINKQQEIIDIIEPIFMSIDKSISKVEEQIEDIDNLIYWLTFSKRNVLEVVNLGSLIYESNIRDEANTYKDNVYSSTKDSLVLQNEYFNRNVSSKDTSKYKIVYKHDLVMSPQNLWMGNINISFFDKPGIVSPSYKVYKLNDSINYENLQNQLKSDVLIRQYINSSRQGASKVRRTLDIEQFMNIKICLHNERVNKCVVLSQHLKNNLLDIKENYSYLKSALINKLIK